MHDILVLLFWFLMLSCVEEVCVLETADAHILTSVEIESITFSSVGLRRKFSFHLLLLLVVMMIMYCVIISFRLVLFYLFFVF
jgi:hypothetical protein